jgi:tRNA (guanine-N7-)-methyltransferase
MSARREYALTELLPKFEISELDRPICLQQELGTEFVVIDFGSGMGDHATKLAANNHNIGVLAIDVHTVGLLQVAEEATRLELTNICTHHGDGMDVFKNWLQFGSIDEIHILFPDPWPKARHHKRRLISPLLLEMAHNLLKPSGRIVFVTDAEDYFESAKSIIEEFGKFTITLDDWEIPVTNYHQRALRLQHKISQLSARKS